MHITVNRYGLGFLFHSIACWLIRTTDRSDGYGRHIYIYGPVEQVEKVTSFLKRLYVFELIFHTATGLAKFAMYVLFLMSDLWSHC